MSVHATPAADGIDVPTDEPDEELSKDEVFHILQTQRRRDALRYLKEHDDPVEMRDMAEQVAAWENDTTVQALTSAERQRVYIALYQSHLPKLDREGIIDYEQSRGVVRREPLAAQFDPYLDEIDADEGAEEDGDGDAQADAEPEPAAPAAEAEPATAPDAPDTPDTPDTPDELAPEATNWFACYHAATLAGAVALAASALGLPVIAALPDVILGTVIVAAFASISVAQTLDRSA